MLETIGITRAYIGEEVLCQMGIYLFIYFPGQNWQAMCEKV